MSGLRGILALCLALTMLSSAASAAVKVDDLYVSAAQVADQSKAERLRGLKEAMRKVLVRISGERDFEESSAVAQAFADVEQFVERYHYAQPSASPETARPGLQLAVRFDSGRVDRLLHENGLPVLGRDRPSTLVWIALDAGKDRTILSVDGNETLRSELEAQAAERGIPLVFPLFDLEDRARLSFADVWGGFMEAVLQASERYHPEAVLVGRLYQSGEGEWKARWVLRDQDRDQQWSDSGPERGRLFSAAIDRVAEALIARYAIHTGVRARTSLILNVSEVASPQDYTRLSKYLGSLGFIARADVISVEPARITYRLEIQGEPAGLSQVLALGDTLIPVQPASSSPGAAVQQTLLPGELNYRLVP